MNKGKMTEDGISASLPSCDYRSSPLDHNERVIQPGCEPWDASADGTDLSNGPLQTDPGRHHCLTDAEPPPWHSLVPPLTDGSIPSLPRWYPRWRGRPVYHGNREALGWATDQVGRAVPFIGSGAFLSTALLRLAKEAAGCETDPPPGSNEVPACHGRVYGIRPSSILTTYTMVVGVVSAILLPFLGAMVDYTPHRRRLGRVLAGVFCLLLFPQIFLTEHTWFAVAIIQFFVAFLGWAETNVTYAYLPELTPNPEILQSYTQSFTVISFSAMVLYLFLVFGISAGFGFADDELAVAWLGQSISFVTASLALSLTWGSLFQTRPAARELPVDQKLWSAGFIQVYRTSRRIARQLPALKWFYISTAFIDAGVHSLATIAVTYLTDTLAFSSQENGVAILLMLLGSIPGAVVSGYATSATNPIYSAMIATCVLTINTVVSGIVLTGPGQQMETYVMAAVWGFGTGWKWTVDRMIASVIIPEGQDAELMGVYLFAGQILTWLPPLIFTIMNEFGVSQRIGISTLAVYFLLGLGALILMGSYHNALVTAGRRVVKASTRKSTEVDGSDTRDRHERHDSMPHQDLGVRNSLPVEVGMTREGGKVNV